MHRLVVQWPKKADISIFRHLSEPFCLGTSSADPGHSSHSSCLVFRLSALGSVIHALRLVVLATRPVIPSLLSIPEVKEGATKGKAMPSNPLSKPKGVRRY